MSLFEAPRSLEYRAPQASINSLVSSSVQSIDLGRLEACFVWDCEGLLAEEVAVDGKLQLAAIKLELG